MPQAAQAQVAVADSGDTAWMLLCAVLVLFAGLPGLLLRHGGQAGARNVLTVMAQGLGIVAGVSLVWAAAGYSLAFAPGSGWLGGAANLMLGNLAALREGLTVPESAFVLFQMVLALFAAGLLAGAVAQRARLGWFLFFAPLWALMVYAPVAHWVWGGGWLAEWGTLDYAGGLVIHVTAGFSALALALVAGARTEPTGPHSPALSLAGGALIWVGWAGIVGGWALGATDDAAVAILNSHFAACAGALMWALLDRLLLRRVSATSVVAGALAGLVAASASAALIGAGGAMMVGVIGTIVCRLGARLVRRWIDDPGHVFAIHGLGGVTGLALLPFLTLPLMGGVGIEGAGLPTLLTGQAIGIVAVALWALVGSAIAALIVAMVVPLRPSEQAEAQGLDAAEHGEQGWDFR